MIKGSFFRYFIVVFVIICLIISGYFINTIRIKQDKHVIFLDENSQIGRTVIRSKLKMPNKLIVSLQGTASDTIMFDSIKIPPNIIDKVIYNNDWYADSAWFYFDANKAKKVNLKVNICFYQ